MPSLVVVGAQWGDEGKGKLVDYLSSRADWAVRFQGGNNAGHTLVVNGCTVKLNLVPSGILHERTCCLIGAGVVIDPEVLLGEMAALRHLGLTVTPARLRIDRDAHLVLAYHKALDAAQEASRGGAKIGTTGRGIGPAYTDRAARCGVRVAELHNLAEIKGRLAALVDRNNQYLQAVLGAEQRIEFATVWEALQAAAVELRPYITNVSLELEAAYRRGDRIVFEGAQGTLLDQVHGTIPYVTSSNTLAGAATVGCGIGPQRLDFVLGVAKAYCTRVGAGPFPTELTDSLGDRIRESGREFGTVTGRPRRCGWFDAMALRRAVRLNGLDALALTKLDVLSGLEQIRICTGYRLAGRELDDLPALISELEQVAPQYREMPGWSEDLSGMRSWSELPAAAQNYLEAIAEHCGCPIAMLSVGAEREATIVRGEAKVLPEFMSAAGPMLGRGKVLG